MEVFEVEDVVVDDGEEGLLLDVVAGSGLLGDCLEVDGEGGDHEGVAEAVVADLSLGSDLEGAQSVAEALLVAATADLELDLALLDDVEALLAKGLVELLLGGEQQVREAGGDQVLEGLAPAAEEEDGGVDHREGVLEADFCIGEGVLLRRSSLNFMSRPFSSSGTRWSTMESFWLMR